MPPEILIDFRNNRAPLLTVAEAARRLGVSKYMARRALEAGELETVTLAGRTWITAASVDGLRAVLANATAA